MKARDATALDRSLALLGARRMIVGHTQTRHLPEGRHGEVLCRFGGRLVCVDVGLHAGDAASWAALVIEGPVGMEWTPRGERILWRDA